MSVAVSVSVSMTHHTHARCCSTPTHASQLFDRGHSLNAASIEEEGDKVVVNDVGGGVGDGSSVDVVVFGSDIDVGVGIGEGVGDGVGGTGTTTCVDVAVFGLDIGEVEDEEGVGNDV